MYKFWYTLCMTIESIKERPPRKIIRVCFYKSLNGSEPVKNWLRSLTVEQKRIIGNDIKTVEYGWPLGSQEQIARWGCQSYFYKQEGEDVFTL
ncbi:hypothetical protein SCG7109_AF_00110 [Chlamydiales bacterium SCGC AG-110-M15]|nr:hypothetical protein SCG7109_AF_00110 [Chlamydiales bacterium SCGC AG-110-M15]